jgi:biotin synthase
MRKRLHISPVLRFRRWSRKGYAVFNSVRSAVSIGTLSGETADTLLPKIKKSHPNNMSLILTLEQRVVEGGQVTYEEALLLSEVLDKEALYSSSDRIRTHFHDNRIDLCSIVNARSGRCSEDCKWCSQSRFHRTDIEVYDLIPAQTAIDQARKNERAGVRKFSLVTSGRAISVDHLNQFCSISDTLRKESGLELCASMGLLNREQLQRLKDVGVRNYHCNLETAPSFFPTLCTTHTTGEKLETLRAAREIGLKLCSGGIIGMGETMAQRIELAMALAELAVESIPLNILNPISGTPLEAAPRLTDEEILTTMAVFRFLNPRAWIRLAGGRTLILPIQDQAFRAGVNATIVGDMLTTKGITMEEDVAHIQLLGFEI